MFAKKAKDPSDDLLSGDVQSAEMKILQDVIELQTNLLNDLISQVGAAFNPNYKPGLFNNEALFQNKKHIAKSLLNFSTAKLSGLHHVGYFLAMVEHYLKLNNEKDPQSLLDKIRGNPAGGTLSVLLN